MGEFGGKRRDRRRDLAHVLARSKEWMEDSCRSGGEVGRRIEFGHHRAHSPELVTLLLPSFLVLTFLFSFFFDFESIWKAEKLINRLCIICSSFGFFQNSLHLLYLDGSGKQQIWVGKEDVHVGDLSRDYSAKFKT